jgi:hypothetical protein
LYVTGSFDALDKMTYAQKEKSNLILRPEVNLIVRSQPGSEAAVVWKNPLRLQEPEGQLGIYRLKPGQQEILGNPLVRRPKQVLPLPATPDRNTFTSTHVHSFTLLPNPVAHAAHPKKGHVMAQSCRVPAPGTFTFTLGALVLLPVIVLLTLPCSLDARDLAGVTMPDTIMVDGKPLVLNGLGLRKKLGVEVYVAGLYLDSPSVDAAAIITADRPKAVRIQFVRDVSKGKLADAFKDALDANAKEKATAQKSNIKTFLGMLTDMKADDVVTYAYAPGKGTTASVGEKQLGTIEGKDFADVLFSAWLGPKPPTEDLKQGMLTAISLPSAPSVSIAGSSAAAKTPGALTNNDVVTLTKAGLGEQIVLSKIAQAQAVDFDTSVDALVNLQKAGVSKAAIDAMIKRSSAVPAAAPVQQTAQSAQRGKRVSAAEVRVTTNTDAVKGCYAVGNVHGEIDTFWGGSTATVTRKLQEKVSKAGGNVLLLMGSFTTVKKTNGSAMMGDGEGYSCP